MKKRVLSAIQPTGDMHLGNYFGAVKNWVDLQEDYDCTYGVVDYHAMTMPYDPANLRNNVWDLILNLLAVGVEPQNLFIQSLVPEHTELCWIFNCFTPLGRLSQMTQFKDKSKEGNGDEGFISAGLLDYPVLQAADILIYRADYVPVGKDQDQHLELSRTIAARFNQQVGKEYFVLPKTLYTETPKILSPADPTRKMSKSAGAKHHINVFAEPDVIRKQIRSAVTDLGDTPGAAMSPGVQNLFEMLKACGEREAFEALMETYRAGQLKYADLKQATGEALVKLTDPFREKKKELTARKKEVKEQIKASAAEIRKRAQQTVLEVKELAGLLNVKY